jgi:hypothetical protein
MFSDVTLLQQSIARQARASNFYEARRKAGQLFITLVLKGTWQRLWARLVGRRTDLLDLNKVQKGAAIQSRHFAGIQEVPISQIAGSEGRTGDFDAEFRPRRLQSQDRWSGVAAALMSGIKLPPVELIKVRDNYFVRDGHHRISAAKAFGQLEIEAEVTVWTP